jgi:ElaB/YqjD/DUF883 family membrane-anchored ribosome-binding protein
MAQRKNEDRGIRDRISSAYENTKERVGEARDRTDEYLRDHPIQSIAIAAGVGAAVAIGVSAFMLRSRKRSFLDKIFDIF